jgi:hypothetical protein
MKPFRTSLLALAAIFIFASASASAGAATPTKSPRGVTASKKKAKQETADPAAADPSATTPATTPTAAATAPKSDPPPAADATKAKTAAAADEKTPATTDTPQPPPAAPTTTSEVNPEPKKPPPNSESLVFGAPGSVDEASIEAGKLAIHPYLGIAGGLKYDTEQSRPNTYLANRVATMALSRLGLKARYLDYVFVESEIMVSGGVDLHGSSAYEGQAALQVRQQVIRLEKWGAMVEVGRVIDEGSIDFFSAHVGETFIQDTATRDPLLFSGFNLGNGVRGTYQLFRVGGTSMRLGLAFNATNPVATTASLSVGGGYPPFDRLYTQPFAQVKQSANNFPDDNFHELVLSPSLLLNTTYFDFRGEAQLFDIDANMSNGDQADVKGYTFRGTMRAKLIDRLLIPFLSSAVTKNDTLVPANVALRSPDRYTAVNFGAGMDVDFYRPFNCSYDCADGIGAQYQQVQFQIGDGLVTTQRYFNLGGTIWLTPNVSFGARFALWSQEAEQPVTQAGIAAGQTKPAIIQQGERSFIAALRFIMP